MKGSDFEYLVEQAERRRSTIRAAKGHDYSGEEDYTACFVATAHIARILRVDATTPSGVATMQVILKLVRDSNLKVRGLAPKNESRQDTLDDLHNYLDLRFACEIEEGLHEAEG